MKHIAKAFLFSMGLAALTTSCSDFLEQTSPSELNKQNVFESVYYTSAAVNKLYGLMTEDATYSQYIPIVWGLNSDCELVDASKLSNFTDVSSERANMNYNTDPGWSRIASVWDGLYEIIENANNVIEGVDGSSLAQSGGSEQRTMQRYKGEALTIRAMAYLDLIHFWGDVPLKLESSQPDLSNAYLEKTDRDIIMDQLIADLKEAVGLLPWAGESADYTTERVTKGYAHALLANIALTRAGWAIREKAKDGYITATDGNSDPVYPTQRCDDATRKAMYELALEHLTTVIKSGKHRLNPSFANEWQLLNQLQLDKTYQENIFEVPMGLSKGGELGYTVGVRINGASKDFGAKGNSSGKLGLTSTLFWSYDKKDLRRDITCCNLQLADNNGVIEEKMLGNKPFALYCGKWDIRKMTPEWRQAAINAGNAKWLTGINCVRMRYPQVLLMYSEVMNELAGPDGGYSGDAGLTARQALGQVHERAFDDKAVAQAYIAALPADKDGFFNAIVDENAWELAGEGFRKFDLIRWNLLSKKIDQFKADYQKQLSEYPEKIYFKYKDATYDSGVTTTKAIDLSSVTWFENLTSDEAKARGLDQNATFWGTEVKKPDVNTKDLLPNISSWLNSTVKNRYLMPISSTTISNSNGKLHNSYGYGD